MNSRATARPKGSEPSLGWAVTTTSLGHVTFIRAEMFWPPRLQTPSVRILHKLICSLRRPPCFHPVVIALVWLLCYHSHPQHLEGISGAHVAISFTHLTFLSVECSQLLTLFWVKKKFFIRGTAQTQQQQKIQYVSENGCVWGSLTKPFPELLECHIYQFYSFRATTAEGWREQECENGSTHFPGRWQTEGQRDDY